MTGKITETQMAVVLATVSITGGDPVPRFGPPIVHPDAAQTAAPKGDTDGE